MSNARLSRLVLHAPISGVVVPIEEVPDAAFADRIVGDGIAIDPVTSSLVAPCSGHVTLVHRSGHAVSISPADGVELIIHIGLDTVSLNGNGFTPRVAAGADVVAGDPLIDFDADYVATHAKSLLTLIVVTTGQTVAPIAVAGATITAGDPLYEIEVGGDAVPSLEASSETTIHGEQLVVTTPTGLHARPAGVIAHAARGFASDIRVVFGDSSANARSVTQIMALEIGCGDAIAFLATGSDAATAVATLSDLVRSGLGEAPEEATVATAPEAAPVPQPVIASRNPNVLRGVAASPGLAVGTVVQLHRFDIEVEEVSHDAATERGDLDSALAQAGADLDALQSSLARTSDAGKAAIFAAHRELLEDPDLVDAALASIAAGKTAAYAWKCAYTSSADRLAALRNELLAARANDLRDVGMRVLKLLTGAASTSRVYPADTILIAEDLTPTDTASLDRSRVLGFATTLGGATSHVAILARSLGIPAVIGTDARALGIADGTTVVLDGTAGTITLQPSAENVAEIRERQSLIEQRRTLDAERAAEPATTTDGHRVEVAANIGGLAEAGEVVRLGGDGVGLLRSEFLFLGRTTAPTEDEQYDVYRGIVEALDGRPLIIRSLDVGGDKPLAYLPIAAEENPFLGMRGIRVGLERPDILRIQFRAVLRAARHGDIRLMLPMVSRLEEFQEARAILEDERAKLGAGAIALGVTVEVPAAAILAPVFAREADFFSIGTNDLTQYTLAMDRGHAKLAKVVDSLEPAVLKLIASTVDGARAHDRWVGVCGGIASDPHAIPILLGLGVDELSVSLPSIPTVKAEVRALNIERCRRLAGRALESGSAAEVRRSVEDEMPEALGSASRHKD